MKNRFLDKCKKNWSTLFRTGYAVSATVPADEYLSAIVLNFGYKSFSTAVIG